MRMIDLLAQHQLEIYSWISGALCVWLITRENILNWPVGMVNNLVLGSVFFTSKLYGQSTLQLIFFLVSIYGWWYWSRPLSDRSRVPVTRLSPSQWSVGILIVTFAWWGVSTGLRNWTDGRVPVLDGLILILGLVAQVLMARKKLENWWIWILFNILSALTSVFRDLYITATLYMIFLGLCLSGLRLWTKSYREGGTL
jgi:nicotinamide mononucleotide transporter